MAKQTDNRDDLRQQILHVFLAGHDSSAVTTGNAIFHLSRNPEVWKKLRSEILSEGEKPLTFESLKTLHYLQYIIKESRCTSPVFMQNGQIIVTSFHALRMLAPGFQPDPDVFRPERWETVRPEWSYLPFGGGPRMCPGRHLALTEIDYVSARMTQEWREVECKDEVKE